MANKLKDLIPSKYHRIVASVMPGGNRWHSGAVDCLSTCPHFNSCRGWGPSGKLCTDDWGYSGSTPIVWMVLKHVFDNFDFYNCDDLDKDDVARAVGEIVGILDFPFDESLSPSEARAIVKVRLKQAEFKANLFSLWRGCSLCNVSVNARFLVASHIRPWSKSDDKEKISQFNGLLLPPNYDYLFDRYLLSFSDDGSLLVHDAKPFESLYKVLGIDREVRLRKVHPENIRYLREHQSNFLKKANAKV